MTVREEDLILLKHGRAYLEARRIRRPLTPDVVIYWTTKQGAAEFLFNCTGFLYAPNIATRLEIVADDDVIPFEGEDQVRVALENRSLVRFNFADWSVTWMRVNAQAGVSEVQAAFGRRPNAMHQMVSQSITGFQPEEVDDFFTRLDEATAAA